MIEVLKYKKKLNDFLELDTATIFSISGRLWTLFAGLATTVLVISFFPPDVQGYYYTFNALIGLQVFAELGLGAVIIYFASHEWSKLSINQDGWLTGDVSSLSRIRSLGRFSLHWYSILALILSACLMVGGYFFFSAKGDIHVDWEIPWYCLALVTGVNVMLIPFWSVLEGCNQVKHVYKYRLCQYMLGSISAWLAIVFGFDLYALSLVGLAGVFVFVFLVLPKYYRFFVSIFFRVPHGVILGWRFDILPMQWRIAVSWISGYLTFSIFVPILFHYHGPVVAGKMGVMWAIMSALLALSQGWVAPKVPRFGILIADKKYTELDALFWHITRSLVVLFAILIALIFVFFFGLNFIGSPYASRLTDASTTGLFLLGTYAVCCSLPMSIYLRAYKEEPLLGVSLVGGISMAVITVFLARAYSVAGVAFGYCLVCWAMTPFIYLIWRRRQQGNLND